MIVNKKLPVMTELKRIINEYQKSTKYPTPTGLLNKLGINYRIWEELRTTPTPQVMLIEAYFQHIVEQIEKLMIYQPDRLKNYKSFEFMLKKLCPYVYGETKTPKETLKEKQQKELIKSIVNEGPIKLA